MYHKTTYDTNFDDLYMHLRSKYPDKLFDLEGIGKQTDMGKFSKAFFSSTTTADTSVDANSNVDDHTVVAYENELPKPYMRLNSLYLIWKDGRHLFSRAWADEMVEAELSGAIYINDLSNVQKPYCYNFSTYDVMAKGLPFVNKVNSLPAKHLNSFCGQMVHFTSYASNQIMGAVGLADLLIVMSYYVKKEFDENPNVPKDYIWRNVKQEMQSLIYSMNQPFRGGLQSGFYNVSIFDSEFLDTMLPDYIFPDGSNPDKQLVQKLQEMFIDLMNETLETSPVTFPVTTATFCVDEERNVKDKAFLEFISKKNQKWGFMNIYGGESSTLSSCCRLRSDKNNRYLGYVNSFGSGGTQIGSFGVVTLNLPHIALISKDEQEFEDNLLHYADMAIKINHVKRYLLKKRIAIHGLPLYDHGFMDLQKQYATIGLCGVYECLQVMGYDIKSAEGQQFCYKIFSMLNDVNDKADNKYEYAHNLEQTPSENSAIKMAAKDKLLGLQDEYELYSNQFIPLQVTANMLERIDLQGKFDSQFSGGSILHLNVDDRIEDYHDSMNLTEAAIKAGCVYFAVNYNIQRCENGHMSVGKNENCPICGKPITNNFIRVVGFLVDVKNFHKVRREHDYPNRQFYHSIKNPTL